MTAESADASAALPVVPARPDQRDAVIGLLVEAFTDDPVVLRLGPGLAGRRLEALFAAEVTPDMLRAGTIDAVWDGGSLLGVGSWEAPRSDQTTPVGWGQRLRQALALGPRRARIVRGRLAELGALRPRTPHWYLSDLAVSGAARGRGVGSALLRARLRRVDADRLPAYLESTTLGSRRLYARFGFEPRGPIPGFAGTDAMAMLRPAH